MHLGRIPNQTAPEPVEADFSAFPQAVLLILLQRISAIALQRRFVVAHFFCIDQIVAYRSYA